MCELESPDSHEVQAKQARTGSTNVSPDLKVAGVCSNTISPSTSISEGHIRQTSSLSDIPQRARSSESSMTDRTGYDSEAEARDLSPFGRLIEEEPAQCPVCFEHIREIDSHPDRRMISLSCCVDEEGSCSICRGCLRTHLRTNGRQCPLQPSHTLDETAACAAFQDNEGWIGDEKSQKCKDLNYQCHACSSDRCDGTFPLPAPNSCWSEQPWPSPCPRCSLAHCGRCGIPWPPLLLQRHLCEDLRHGDMQAQLVAESLASPLQDIISQSITSPARAAVDVETAFRDIRRCQLDDNAFGLSAANIDSLRRRLQQTGLLQRRLGHNRTDERTDAGRGDVQDDHEGFIEWIQTTSLWDALQQPHARHRMFAHAVEELARERFDGRVPPLAFMVGDAELHLRMGDFGAFERRREVTSRRLQQLDEENPTKECPSCHIPIQRDGGCNMVSCRCGTRWCFVCEAIPGITGSRCTDFACSQEGSM